MDNTDEVKQPIMIGKRALPALSLTNDMATLTSLAQHHGWHDVEVYILLMSKGMSRDGDSSP